MTNPNTPKKKILVVDDTDFSRNMTVYALDGEGYDVKSARTVAEALAMAATEQPPFKGYVADNHIVGETTTGIADMASGLTAANLPGGLVGYTSDPNPPTAADVYGGASPDRYFEVVQRSGAAALFDAVDRATNS